MLNISSRDMKYCVLEIKQLKLYKLIHNDPTVQSDIDWDDEKKSLLIHSILIGYPIPPIYFTEDEDGYCLLDGKQRISTVLEFLYDGFILSEKTPLILVKGENKELEEFSIAGFQFSQLPKDIQLRIGRFKFDFKMMKNLEPEQRYEMYQRLNKGAVINENVDRIPESETDTKNKIEIHSRKYEEHAIAIQQLDEKISKIEKLQQYQDKILKDHLHRIADIELELRVKFECNVPARV